MIRLMLSTCLALACGAPAAAQAPDWGALEKEALLTLQRYIRIDTSNPPGDVGKAADFLETILKAEQIPTTRYESAPGRSIILARLARTRPGTAKPILLMHHMDVVPTDASRWKRPPFGAEIAEGAIWGRGAFDMKGPGVAHLYAFIALKRMNVPLDRDVLLMASPDEEIGGGMGAEWMRKTHFADLDPEYILDEGGFGSREVFSPGRLVFGISVAEKKLLWLKLTAEGVAGHGSQPNDQNPNDRLTRALARLLSEPLPTSEFSVLTTFKSNVGTLAQNKFTNAIQHSTIAITSLRSGVGEPPKANVIPSIAEATLDCRVLPGTTTAQWLAEIRRRLGDPGIRIDMINEGEDPVVTPSDSPFYQALEATLKQRYPDAIVTPMLVPYGTDANGFRPLGVKSYGFTPVILSAAAIASIHGDAEFLPQDALGPAIQIIFDTVRATAGR